MLNTNCKCRPLGLKGIMFNFTFSFLVVQRAFSRIIDSTLATTFSAHIHHNTSNCFVSRKGRQTMSGTLEASRPENFITVRLVKCAQNLVASSICKDETCDRQSFPPSHRSLTGMDSTSIEEEGSVVPKTTILPRTTETSRQEATSSGTFMQEVSRLLASCDGHRLIATIEQLLWQRASALEPSALKDHGGNGNCEADAHLNRKVKCYCSQGAVAKSRNLPDEVLELIV